MRIVDWKGKVKERNIINKSGSENCIGNYVAFDNLELLIFFIILFVKNNLFLVMRVVFCLKLLNWIFFWWTAFPLVQTKIIDFFRIKRSTESTQKLSQGKQKILGCGFVDFVLIDGLVLITLCSVFFYIYIDIHKKRKRSGSLVMSKKRRKLLPFNPSEDPERRLEQMRSLATALTASGTEFSNELTYRPSMALRSANQPALEKGGMQVKIGKAIHLY